ncbi:hypothetical protein CVO96_09450 [Deinococcus koreensis]|uniref:Uncharacterized protein n=2 Tax=Deinococcus koreensis TaxID=2054903 RepID=A0A2K3UYF9_9DEIO|nr:hypothetical protein CVO96_09450 [Deinococcus koreensis]
MDVCEVNEVKVKEKRLIRLATLTLGIAVCSGAAQAELYRKVFDARSPTALAWQLQCRAPGAEDIQAGMFFAKASPSMYKIARVEYNAKGREVFENGSGLPTVKRFYDTYITGEKPISQPALRSALWAWKTFGSRFRWGEVTYRCQFS